MQEVSQQALAQAVEAFACEYQNPLAQSYGSGHINDTYLVTGKCGGPAQANSRLILQRINTDIFVHPEQVLENISRVTEHIRTALQAEGKDPGRGTLTLMPSQEGKLAYVDCDGGWWRCYLFVEDTVSFDKVERPEDFYSSALAFGHFQKQLADFPAETLHETIPAFHDTRKRFADFKKAVAEDVVGRAAGAAAEIQFVLDHEADARYFAELLERGELPLRVTHNDTKLNNILMDKATGEAICVIDLDTVMPGLAINDYGDSIRFGASTALEDERDLDKVWLDLELFEVYTKGFIEGCEGSLTGAELDNLPMAAKGMTLECGMRFLADHLQGDVYFKVHREGHNLDRARTQFKLVADMEAKWEQMQQIVAKYR